MSGPAYPQGTRTKIASSSARRAAISSHPATLGQTKTSPLYGGSFPLGDSPVHGVDQVASALREPTHNPTRESATQLRKRAHSYCRCAPSIVVHCALYGNSSAAREIGYRKREALRAASKGWHAPRSAAWLKIVVRARAVRERSFGSGCPRSKGARARPCPRRLPRSRRSHVEAPSYRHRYL